MAPSLVLLFAGFGSLHLPGAAGVFCCRIKKGGGHHRVLLVVDIQTAERYSVNNMGSDKSPLLYMPSVSPVNSPPDHPILLTPLHHHGLILGIPFHPPPRHIPPAPAFIPLVPLPVPLSLHPHHPPPQPPHIPPVLPKSPPNPNLPHPPHPLQPPAPSHPPPAKQEIPPHPQIQHQLPCPGKRGRQHLFW